MSQSKADALLKRVHERLGRIGVDIRTYGETGNVEVYWRRNYGDGYGLSDERYVYSSSLVAALQAVLDYEDDADRDEA